MEFLAVRARRLVRMIFLFIVRFLFVFTYTP